MNPLTNVKNITKLNETELAKGTTDKKSWHDMYKDSAWIFIGGLAFGLTEGDVLAVFSQYGEIVNINLVRDKKTGKTKGFCFLCYQNQKSTILAVDNLNGIKLCSRTIRVDHVADYKPPKDNDFDDEITKKIKSEGCAPKPIVQEPMPNSSASSSKKKKSKKEKKKHKKDKKQKRDKSLHKKVRVKTEIHDPGYDKYELLQNNEERPNKNSKRKASESESSSSENSSEESFVPSKKHKRESDYSKKATKNLHRNEVNENSQSKKSRGDKNLSNKKHNFRDSESNSSGEYHNTKRSDINNKYANDSRKKRNNSDSDSNSGEEYGEEKNSQRTKFYSKSAKDSKRKHNRGDSDSDSSSDYGKQKHSKLSKLDNKNTNEIAHHSRHRHDSGSSEDSPEERNKASNSHRNISYEHQRAAYPSSSKNQYNFENRGKEHISLRHSSSKNRFDSEDRTEEQSFSHSSSKNKNDFNNRTKESKLRPDHWSSEDSDQPYSRYDESRDRDSIKHKSKGESSKYKEHDRNERRTYDHKKYSGTYDKNSSTNSKSFQSRSASPLKDSYSSHRDKYNRK